MVVSAHRHSRKHQVSPLHHLLNPRMHATKGKRMRRIFTFVICLLRSDRQKRTIKLASICNVS